MRYMHVSHLLFETIWIFILNLTCHGGTDCLDGFYSEFCNQRCGHCSGSFSCNKETGMCLEGCNIGWRGSFCTEKIPVLGESSPLTPALIIASIVIIVLFIITVIVVIMFIIKMRRKRRLLDEIIKATTPITIKVNNDEEQGQFIAASSLEHLADQRDSVAVYQNNQTTAKRKKLIAESVPISYYWDVVASKTKEEFDADFKNLTSGLSKKYDAAIKHPLKNKYRRIYPYDFNRVVLNRESNEGTDFINASRIKGYEKKKNYIASQGPTHKMVDDYWWMIWQEKTECMVMLTNLIEMEMVKCIQYWPDEGEQTYGEVKVRILMTDTFSDYVVRRFEISVSERTRTVMQFHFKAWPDNDVPGSAWSIVNFWRAVREKTSGANYPIVVHCSAGVGRTGTFIALDVIYEKACKKGQVTVFKTVETLRKQRVNMVQTEGQYRYLHEVVAEALCIGTKSIFQNQFPDVVRYLMEKDVKAAKSRLEGQFDILFKTECKKGRRKEPISSNTFNTSSQDSVFLGLPDLSNKDVYFVSECTDPERFWTFLWEKKVKTVVSVGAINVAMNSLGKVADIHNLAGVTVICKKEEKSGTVWRQYFEMTSDKGERCLNCNVFLILNWKEQEKIPSKSKEVVSLLEEACQWHSSPSEAYALVIRSSHGLDKCGVLYILLYEFERMRRDGEINILQTAKKMMGRNSSLIHHFEQYVFLYEVILDKVSMDSIHQNAAQKKDMLENTRYNTE